MESVLEISTEPCANTAEAGEQLRSLRRQGARQRIGQGPDDRLGRHASVRDVGGPADRRRARYRDLISALRFVARQELIFGMHVHVGIDDPDKAIHVANGMRVHLPVLLALSANSPFWRADATGLLSTRTPIFRAFPRVGIPPGVPRLGGLQPPDRVHGRLGRDGRLHLPLVRRRPHPNFGTVEIRVCDAQTRVEHTLALAALIQAMVHELAADFEAGEELPHYSFQILDENKWLAARHGLGGELVDLPSGQPDRHRISRGACSTACASTPRAGRLGP